MSVVHQSIIVEDVFGGMFSQLPTIVSAADVEYPVVFEFGDKLDLQDFLKQSQGSTRPYPLLWLLSPYNEEHNKNNLELTSISLVIAVETNSSMLPSQRMEEIFKPILYPLLDNIKKCFLRSSTIDVDNYSYNVTKYYNYSGEDNDGLRSELPDIWDAMKITFDCRLNNACQRKINFN